MGVTYIGSRDHKLDIVTEHCDHAVDFARQHNRFLEESGLLETINSITY